MLRGDQCLDAVACEGSINRFIRPARMMCFGRTLALFDRPRDAVASTHSINRLIAPLIKYPKKLKIHHQHATTTGRPTYPPGVLLCTPPHHHLVHCTRATPSGKFLSCTSAQVPNPAPSLWGARGYCRVSAGAVARSAVCFGRCFCTTPGRPKGQLRSHTGVARVYVQGGTATCMCIIVIVQHVLVNSSPGILHLGPDPTRPQP